ncbi:MAG: hypothetical protein WKF40_04920 [Thermoleophilaceae bacterium]
MFCEEEGVHRGEPVAYRVPAYPPGHPGRIDEHAEFRGVLLPGAPQRAAAA